MKPFTLPVPARYADITPADITARDDYQKRALAEVSTWLASGEHPGAGFLFIGPPGRGKTMFASAICNVTDAGFLHVSHYERLLRRKMDLKSAWEKGYDDTAYAAWVKVDHALAYIQTELTVLALDDLGKEHHTGTKFMQDELDWLLRHRFDLGLPTLATSNLQPEQFGPTYSPAMRSFIHEAFHVIVLAGDDYR